MLLDTYIFAEKRKKNYQFFSSAWRLRKDHNSLIKASWFCCSKTGVFNDSIALWERKKRGDWGRVFHGFTNNFHKKLKGENFIFLTFFCLLAIVVVVVVVVVVLVWVIFWSQHPIHDVNVTLWSQSSFVGVGSSPISEINRVFFINLLHS